jgi:hypothetical protein
MANSRHPSLVVRLSQSEGDPWFVFCDSNSGESFAHFVRIGGEQSFEPRASTAYLPEPSCVSWLTTSLTCVPADGRRPSATVLHLPRDGAPPCLPASVDSLATLAPLFFSLPPSGCFFLARAL